MLKRILFITLSLFLINSVFAQDILDGKPNTKFKDSGGIDGAYKKDIRDGEKDRLEQKYHHVREADVMWATKIWRDIDLREKINQVFYYPTQRINDRASLIDVLMDGINAGDITPYGNATNDDEFKEPMTDSQIARIGIEGTGQPEIFEEYDEELDSVIQIIDNPKFVTSEVVRYRIKEEWFFDKQRSVMDVRIIGICPLKEVNKEGLEGQLQPLFWVYFPEARKVLKKAEVFNHRKNDAARLTYDDLFHKRFFNSYIVKESNKYDRYINKYKVGLDALVEAERIKDEIFNIEHDLWEY